MTAAHCVDDSIPRDLRIQYGFTDISKPTKNIALVKEVIIHEDFEPESLAHDIALLRLKTFLQYKKNLISKVVLPPQGFEVLTNDSKAALIGWRLNAVKLFYIIFKNFML